MVRHGPVQVVIINCHPVLTPLFKVLRPHHQLKRRGFAAQKGWCKTPGEFIAAKKKSCQPKIIGGKVK